ncbi:MAG: hypothetical protein AAGB16_09115, partial [Pseudomonadota bacterium]
MTSADALDLSAIDPPIWRMLVNEVVYGPYTLGQMRSFVDENRLSETSQVAAGDGGAFMAADKHEALAFLFVKAPPAPE